MDDTTVPREWPFSEHVEHHAGFRRMFAPGRLTLGFILSLEAYPDMPAPTMRDHVTVMRYADQAGFAGVCA
ncbi:hypothetical protein ACUDA6_12510 [Pseudomonas ceruminis]|uniref:hypothetical protein n=1 Tax=Pseudomonas putida group TaxID=136845 RepID=UPI003D004F0B